MDYKKFIKSKCSGLMVILLLISQISEAQKFKENFIDSTDNAFDISTWLSQVYGFLPVVGLITEPATGFGAAVGLLHIHKMKA